VFSASGAHDEDVDLMLLMEVFLFFFGG
jgi:hypothetical protein